jgi:hypothetical protein
MRKAKKGSLVIGNKIAGISKIVCEYEGDIIYQLGIYLFPFSIEFTLENTISLQIRIRIWKMCLITILEKKEWDKQ